jgi:hypothetical protein
MKEAVGLVLTINILRYLFVFLILLFEFFSKNFNITFYSSGFISGLWVTILYFFASAMDLLIATIIAYLFEGIVSSKASISYLMRRTKV